MLLVCCCDAQMRYVTPQATRVQEHKRQLLSAAFAKRSAEELRDMRIAHVKLLLHV